MSAHTPGPLRVARAKNGGGDYAVIDADKNVVAEFYEDIREQGECAREEAKANATLYAAAPDLLEALVAIGTRLLICGPDVSAQDAYDSFYQEIVKDAIAKATRAKP